MSESALGSSKKSCTSSNSGFSAAVHDADATVIKEMSPIVARLVLDNRMTIAIHEASLPMTIGRGLDCDISIPDNHISRHHCEVSSVNGVLCLKDTSVNGTFVGDRKLNEESVTIPKACKINLGGSFYLRLIPEDDVEERRKKNDRRNDERRRSIERRSDNHNVVDFEQRNVERRVTQRRVMSRRAANG